MHAAPARSIVEQNYQRVWSLLLDQRSLLDMLAAELKEREEIGGAELRQRVLAQTTSESAALAA